MAQQKNPPTEFDAPKAAVEKAWELLHASVALKRQIMQIARRNGLRDPELVNELLPIAAFAIAKRKDLDKMTPDQRMRLGRRVMINQIKKRAQKEYATQRAIQGFIRRRKSQESIPSIPAEERKKLAHVISRLPLQDREAIMLKLEGVSDTEIARRASTSVNSVYQNRKNAMKTIRRKMR
jgi:DNA-directed RNA polymerase specialized sigma subunit